MYNPACSPKGYEKDPDELEESVHRVDSRRNAVHTPESKAGTQEQCHPANAAHAARR
jgi:hypothetical protein